MSAIRMWCHLMTFNVKIPKIKKQVCLVISNPKAAVILFMNSNVIRNCSLSYKEVRRIREVSPFKVKLRKCMCVFIYKTAVTLSI